MFNRRIIAAAGIAAAVSAGVVVTAPTAVAACTKDRQFVHCEFTETTSGPGPHKNWTTETTTTTTIDTLGNPNNKPQATTTTSSDTKVKNPAGKEPPGQQ
jgi:hypothetical protein